MAMTRPSTALRAGLVALVITGVLYVGGTWLRGPFIMPTADPAGFAAQAASATFFIAANAYVAGLILHLLAVLTVYGYAHGAAERPARAGLILSLLGLGLSLAFAGPFLFVYPAVGTLYLQGQTAAMAVAIAASGPLFLAAVVIAALLVSVGAVLLGVALWRQGRVARWAVILFIISPFLFSTPVVGPVLEIGGDVIFLAATVAILVGLWGQAAA